MANSENNIDEMRRTVRSFVRREGRITKGQKRAVTELLPALEIDLDQTLPIDMNALFGRDRPVTIEIGFGDGGALVAMAGAEPEVNFIGAEVYRPGVGKMLLGLEEQALTNVRVFADDATALLAQGIAEQSVDRILVYFPDPWPKKRHLKRRLIQADFAELVANRLKPDGVLHVATDIESYAEQVIEILEACDVLTNSLANTVDSPYSPRPLWRPETKYERRGTRLGHSVFDIIYRRR